MVEFDSLVILETWISFLDRIFGEIDLHLSLVSLQFHIGELIQICSLVIKLIKVDVGGALALLYRRFEIVIGITTVKSFISSNGCGRPENAALSRWCHFVDDRGERRWCRLRQSRQCFAEWLK